MKPSEIASLLRYVARGAFRGAPPLAEIAALQRGRVFRERGGIEIDGARVRGYARATGGDHLFAFYGEGAVAPPFYSATWEPAILLELLAGVRPALPVAPVVHLSTETVWARPLRPGDTVRCRVELMGAEPVRRGIAFTVATRNFTGTERLCSESTATFLLRVRHPEGSEAPRLRAEREPPAAPERGWVEMVRWSLPASAGRRYARVSGDYNPIHLWGVTARPFGFRAPILHGYAIAARAAHTLVDLHLHGDPTALKRMRIAFRAPLPLPSTARLLVNDTASERWFRVVGAEDGPVHAEGTFGGATR